MTYGRSLAKALDTFHIDARKWHELAADRAAWRETLRLGHPPGFVPPPPTPPLALTRPTRRAATDTNRAIEASVRALRAPPPTDAKRLATAAARRRTSLDGERIHPHPGHPRAQTQRTAPKIKRRVDTEFLRQETIEREHARLVRVKEARQRWYLEQMRIMRRRRVEAERAAETAAGMAAAGAQSMPPPAPTP